MAGWGVFASIVLSACGDGLLPASSSKENGKGGGKRSILGSLPIAKPTIPVQWTLTDVEGRKLDATIVGKNGTTITLVRTSDGKRFDLPVDRLSESDKKRVNDLDNKAAPSKHPMESAHYRMGHGKLAEIDARIAEMQSIYGSTNSEIKRRSAFSELERLIAERAEILEELRDLEKF
jgi:hypothetical protein